jgi:single stranded DNA-binding protein
MEKTIEENTQDTGEKEAVPERQNLKTHWNWVQLSGRIASEVTQKTIREQNVINCTLLFESQRKTDKEGSHANFIDVELWGKMAEMFYPMLAKGMQILVSGELFQQRWQAKDGRKAQKFCISAQAIAITDQTYKPN